jgi:hypothetical protein
VAGQSNTRASRSTLESGVCITRGYVTHDLAPSPIDHAYNPLPQITLRGKPA